MLCDLRNKNSLGIDFRQSLINNIIDQSAELIFIGTASALLFIYLNKKTRLCFKSLLISGVFAIGQEPNHSGD